MAKTKMLWPIHPITKKPVTGWIGGKGEQIQVYFDTQNPKNWRRMPTLPRSDSWYYSTYPEEFEAAYEKAKAELDEFEAKVASGEIVETMFPEWVEERPIWTETLRITGTMAYGKDGSSDYVIHPSELGELLAKCTVVKGEVTAQWSMTKRGTRYGIQFHDEWVAETPGPTPLFAVNNPEKFVTGTFEKNSTSDEAYLRGWADVYSACEDDIQEEREGFEDVD